MSQILQYLESPAARGATDSGEVDRKRSTGDRCGEDGDMEHIDVCISVKSSAESIDSSLIELGDCGMVGGAGVVVRTATDVRFSSGSVLTITLCSAAWR